MKDYTKLTLSDFAIKVEGNRKEIEAFYERQGCTPTSYSGKLDFIGILTLANPSEYSDFVSGGDDEYERLTLPEALTWEVVNKCEFPCDCEVKSDHDSFRPKEIHGYVPTIYNCLIDKDGVGWRFARLPQPQDTAESLLREVLEASVYDYKGIPSRIEKFLNEQSK